MGKCDEPIRLQVLISAYGRAGMDKIAACEHPRAEGVEYLVSWQLPEEEADTPLPPQIASRSDFSVQRSNTRGVSVNRNLVMGMATAPYCLLSDDDVSYPDAGCFARIVEEFERLSADLICFKAEYGEGASIKPHPEAVCRMTDAPKGWYATGFEMAYRRDSAAGRTPFNEHFGVATPYGFLAGEEDIWLYDSRKAGASSYISPLTICVHDHSTTCDRHGKEPWFVMTNGAINYHLHPLTWPLRIVVHGFRQKGVCMSVCKYVGLCVKGILKARRLGCFSS